MEAARPVRPRRNLRWIAVGVLAVCLGGLGAALLYANLSGAQEVLLVKRTVLRDQVITVDDLAVTSVVPAPGVASVPAERLEAVVGSTAQYDLIEGGLLSPAQFGEPRVVPGMARVGLRLAPGRVPKSPIPSGSPVLLVALAAEGDKPGASVSGQIASEPTELPDGGPVIDVMVPAEVAERVARLAAGDQLVLVQAAR